MTRKQLFNALKNHKYIAVRWWDGAVTGANCKIAERGRIRHDIYPDDTETRIQSFYPITFQEYIRIKTPAQ